MSEGTSLPAVESLLSRSQMNQRCYDTEIVASPSIEDAELMGVSVDIDTSNSMNISPHFIEEENMIESTRRSMLSPLTADAFHYSSSSYPSENLERSDATLSFSEAKYKSQDPLFQRAVRYVTFNVARVFAKAKPESDGGESRTGFTFYSVALLFQTMFYDAAFPEFTSLQQFSWAVVIGVIMGLLTAIWKAVIDVCVDFVWKVVPEWLFSLGIFTDMEGLFPIYHYMWITPAFFGGILSYIFAALQKSIPGQNDWIDTLHSRGVQDPDTLMLLFLLSTAGMVSGLSLGPELPLILTAGMIGSWLGVVSKQSVLSARCLNLTAASAAIGGFFGFPMAGALFVLEVPHRMGLQYFEALSPATISSIIAVLTNRLATGNDVTGYYKYPFLNETLPSSIFHDAIVYGVVGAAIGIIYTKVVLFLKNQVHNLFVSRYGSDSCCDEKSENITNETFSTVETIPLVTRASHEVLMENTVFKRPTNYTASGFSIQHEPTRMGLIGIIVGTTVGVTCMFFPHVMFWGESQLQCLIDKGKTPLPIFGGNEEASSGLIALGVCVVDKANGTGFTIGCSAATAVAKIFVTGLSLGTGIVGGHFWAPLFVGCAVSHFLTDSIATISGSLGVSISLSNYPCVALLCIMGSVHVVAFRAHMAIILILTLTIDAFDPKDNEGGSFRVAGDYSAVFPLLTVAVFVSLQVSRQTVFYGKQRSRGDITALPEVLCEPGKVGHPLVMDFDGYSEEIDVGHEYDDNIEVCFPVQSDYGSTTEIITSNSFDERFNSLGSEGKEESIMEDVDSASVGVEFSSVRMGAKAPSPLPPRPKDRKSANTSIREEDRPSTEGMRLGNRVIEEKMTHSVESAAFFENADGKSKVLSSAHRRTMSEPYHQDVPSSHEGWREDDDIATSVNSRKQAALVRVSSFGEIYKGQPSLLDQARNRAASFAGTEREVSVRRRSFSSVSQKISKEGKPIVWSKRSIN